MSERKLSFMSLPTGFIIMASPQKENGFTAIANELVEALARTELCGTQFALILAIIRKTYGYHKKQDRISISQFMEILGVSKRAVIYNLQDLEAKHIIKVKREQHGAKNEVNIISLNKDYDTWVVQNCAPQVEKNRGSAKLRKKAVQNSVNFLPSFAPTKETITKENKSSDKSQNMGWNNKSDNDDDLPSIDMDTREPERDLEDERKKKVTALIEWAERTRGKKFLDTPTQRKFINDMRTAGISPAIIKQTYQELLVSEYWQGRSELPDFKTVFSNLKNRK